jgi:heterodisulfide reductase subunit C
VKRTVGDNILNHGYCVYIDEITLEDHPEQGPIWEWYRNNASSILKRLGANYKGNGAGTMRNIAQQDLDELRQIFNETGATERFENFEKDYHEQ